MTTKSNSNSFEAQTATLDAFMALARISFASTERLSGLTLAAARKTVEDCVSAAKAASAISGGQGLDAVQSGFGQAMFERGLSYSREAYEVVAGAQQEAAQLLGQKFALPGIRFPGSENMNEAFNMFTGGFQRLSAMTANNVAAATDAGSKLARQAESSAKKVA